MAKCLINGTNNNGNTGRAIEVMNFFVGKGLSPTQACAIAGNCYVESGKAYDPKSLNKNDCNASKTKCGPSYGLFQWHDVCTRKNPDGSWDDSSCTGRFKNLKTYCANNRLDYTTMKGQLEFLWHENAGGFKEYFQTNNKLSIEAYTKWWEQHWEVCGTCDHNARVSEAKRLAGLYNQMNKTECNVDTSGSSSGNSGFGCNDDTTLDSSVSAVEESSTSTTSSDAGGGNTNGGNSDTNTIDRRPIFIGDYVGYNICKKSKMSGHFRNFSKEGVKFGLQGILKTVANILSNKKNKPKCIVFYLGDGVDFSFAKSIEGLRDRVNEWLYEVSGKTVYTNVYFFSSVHPSKDMVDGTTPNTTNTYQYAFNEKVKEWASESINNYANFVRLAEPQRLILNSGNTYRSLSNGKYVFNDNAFNMLGGSIYEYMKTKL